MAKTNEEIKDVVLPKELVWNMLEFANALSGMNGIYPAALNPYLTNSRLKDVTLVDSGEITENKVEKALANPKNSERELLAISENLEYSSTSYRRIIDYISNLPAFDMTYHCRNIEDVNDYKSKDYKKALDVIKRFCNSFDYKKEFSIATKQMFREETFFSVFRDEGQKYTLQQLPSDRCMITGRWDYGILFTFDYAYFLQGGIDIGMFPEIFKTTYLELFTHPEYKYLPSASIDDRNKNMWAYQVDCSPTDGFWAFKLRPQIALRVPYFAGLFPDFAMQNMMRNLQKSSYMAAAAKIVFGEVPYLNKESKTTLRDNVAISPKLLGEFLQLIISALKNESVKTVAAPLTNVKALEFTNDNDIYSSWLHTTLGAAGINSNLLFSGDTKPNALETELSANVDELITQDIYPYFNNFMDYQINKILEKENMKYRFGFKFEGSNFYQDRTRRLKIQTDLMAQGIVNPQKISAALGQNPFEFQSQLDEARINDWTSNLTPIVPAAQTSANAGRPSKNLEDLGEEGLNTRDAASNKARKKK